MKQEPPDDPRPAQPSGGGTGFRLLGGAAMTALSRAVSQLCQLTIFIYAARTLGPADFGLFALVSACAIVALRVAEAGWSEYIMAWSGAHEIVRKVVGIAWLSGLAMALTGLASAGVALSLFDQPEIALLLAGFAVWILLATPSAAWNGVMIWQGRIATFASVTMMAEGVGLVVTLLMLSKGYGIMSLVGGRLVQQSIHVVLAVFMTRLLPSFRQLRQDLPGLIGFSASILSSRLILTLGGYSSVFIVGGFFGPASVGFYRASQRVVGASSELIGEPIKLLAWNSFRAVRDTGTTEAYQKFANLFFPIVLVIALPVYLWISFFAHPIIVGLLGLEWAPAAPVISILAVAALVGVIGHATEPLMSLTGHASFLPRFYATYAGLSIAATLTTGAFGMIAVAFGHLFLNCVFIVYTLYIYQQKLGFLWRPVFARLLPALLPLSCAFAVLSMTDQLEFGAQMNMLLRALLVSLPALAVYLALLALFYRDALKSFWQMTR